MLDLVDDERALKVGVLGGIAIASPLVVFSADVHPNMFWHNTSTELVAAKEMRYDLSQLRACIACSDELALWLFVVIDRTWVLARFLVGVVAIRGCILATVDRRSSSRSGHVVG